MATSMSPESTTIAFLGATGGCANACLAHTLKAGYKAVALARTPSKLTDQLHDQGFDDATLEKNLTIVQGDATDPEAVKRTISPAQNGNNNSSSSSSNALVSTIVSGLGAAPKLQLSAFEPVSLDNKHVCETAMQNLISATRELQSQSQKEQARPLLAFVSTTGISDKKEDVPLSLRMFGYRALLHVPHEDKRKMERLAFASMESSDDDDDDAGPPPFRGMISIRPTLLTGDQSITSGKGWKNLRAGTDMDPALGYTVSRADVGEWIFEEIVRTGGEKWINQGVTLTG